MIDVKTDPKTIPDNLPDPFGSPKLCGITRFLGTTSQHPKKGSSLDQIQLGGSPRSGLVPKSLNPFLPMGLEPPRDRLPAHFQPPRNLGLSNPFPMLGNSFKTTTFKLDGISCCSHSS